MNVNKYEVKFRYWKPESLNAFEHVIRFVSRPESILVLDKANEKINSFYFDNENVAVIEPEFISLNEVD